MNGSYSLLNQLKRIYLIISLLFMKIPIILIPLEACSQIAIRYSDHKTHTLQKIQLGAFSIIHLIFLFYSRVSTHMEASTKFYFLCILNSRSFRLLVTFTSSLMFPPGGNDSTAHLNRMCM